MGRVEKVFIGFDSEEIIDVLSKSSILIKLDWNELIFLFFFNLCWINFLLKFVYCVIFKKVNRRFMEVEYIDSNYLDVLKMFFGDFDY